MSVIKWCIRLTIILVLFLSGCAASGNISTGTPERAGDMLSGEPLTSAYHSQAGSLASITAEEIRVRVLESTETVDSYSYSMNLDIQCTAPEQKMVNQKTEINGSMDKINKRMLIKLILTQQVDSDISSASTSKAEIYIENNRLYMKVSEQEVSGQWQEQVAPEDLWEEQDIISQQTKILENASLSLTGKDLNQGVDCYLLEISPDPLIIRDALAQQMKGLSPDSEIDLEQALQDLKIKTWVDPDTFTLLRVWESLKLKMHGLVTGNLSDNKSKDITAEMTMDIRAFNYNQPGQIEKPYDLR